MRFKRDSVLPGFGLTMGISLLYLSLLVLMPLSALVLRALEMSWTELWTVATDPRSLASYRITCGASFVGAFINLFLRLLTTASQQQGTLGA